LEDKWKDKWKDRFKLPKDFSLKKLKKDQLLILLLTGILLLVIAIPVPKGSEGIKNDKNVSSGEEVLSTGGNVDFDYIAYLEEHLAGTLSQIDGAGEVDVMITLKSSTEKIIEKDKNQQTETVTESDSQGGTRTTNQMSHEENTIYEESSDNGKEPYVSKTITPQIEGVLVIASGGDSALVKENITEAVRALFDIDTHKIRIMKRSDQKS